MYHPKTGVHYAHVVPGQWGPYMDIHATWSKFASLYPWISVHVPKKLDTTSSLWNDKNVLIIMWQGGVPAVHGPKDRAAKVALVYSESLVDLRTGDRSLLLQPHLEELSRLEAAVKANQYDALFCHTPWSQTQLQGLGIPVFLLPVGWDEDVYGNPGFDSTKIYDYVYYGSPAGRRETIIPYLKQKLGDKIRDISGTYGNEVTSELDMARAQLYIKHSNVTTFSTWRIWQTLGTSAALVGEQGDHWPLDPKRHMVLLDGEWSDDALKPRVLERILTYVDLSYIAKTAHEEIAKHYTCKRCIEEFLVPAGAVICGR